MKLIQPVLFLFLVLHISVYGQRIEGRVIDATTSVGLADVSFYSADGNLISVSTIDGRYELPNPGQFTLTRLGYQNVVMDINATNGRIIVMQPSIINLEEVIVVSDHFRNTSRRVPAAVSVIDQSDILCNNRINVSPVLNTVAGVHMQSATLTTNRITIRGIGARSLFGTSKIRAYFKDIPLTNGSGESTMEDIDITTLGRIEVLKGPSSSIYGAGLGGTIQFIPDYGTFRETSSYLGYDFGSYGMNRTLLKVNVGTNAQSTAITYSDLQADGYRANNQTRRKTLSLIHHTLIGEKDQLYILGNFTDLKAYIPSSLNRDDYIENPEAAAFTWGQARGYEDYKKGLFGVSWEHRFNEKTTQYTSAFVSFLDLYEPRPFNILSEDNLGLGLRTRWNTKTRLFNRALDWVIGGELFSDSKAYATFENLYRDAPAGTGSVQGDPIADLEERRSYANVFAESRLQMSNTSVLSLGFNLNTTRYRIEGLSGTSSGQSSSRHNFDLMISPRIGWNQQLGRQWSLYAAVSHGFSPPALDEILLPDNTINTDVQPETGWNYEIGVRSKLFEDRMQVELAAYQMNIRNLLVSRRSADDQFVGVNAGKTRFFAVELSTKNIWRLSKSARLIHSNALSTGSYEFRTFIDGENDYSGNELTGMPSTTFTSLLFFTHSKGWYANWSFQYVDRMPLRDDNSVFSEAYQVSHAKMGYRSPEDKPWQIDVFAGLNNIFDARYASMVLINAGSFGNNLPRYYYPANPRNYYVGTSIRYRF